MKPAKNEEITAAFHLTSCMFSIGFLDDISKVIVNDNENKFSLIDFYSYWIKHRQVPNLLPITSGVIMGYLFMGILFSKEIWFDLIPDVPIAESEHKWCLYKYRPICPKMKKPTLKYVIRRIRNSLGHGYAKTKYFEYLKNRDKLNNMEIEFYDQNTKDPKDTFTIEIKLNDLRGFIQQFQDEIYKKVILKTI
jgi:HEPN pEK499 p136